MHLVTWRIDIRRTLIWRIDIWRIVGLAYFNLANFSFGFGELGDVREDTKPLEVIAALFFGITLE